MAQTIGERLKQAREARGLTLEQASQSTHIRPNYLEALEADQRDALPSNVQGRGFLRLYAGLLDLDVPALLAQWDGKLQPEAAAAAGAAAGAAGATAQSMGKTANAASEPGAATGPAAPAGFTPAEEILPGMVDTAAQVPPAASMPPARTGDSTTSTPRPRASEERKSTPRDSAPVSMPVEAPEGTSAAIFAAIGVKLREQRKNLGLSLAEVERYTRLRVHYIQALEDGRLEDLPSQVQGRGMLSNYVSFLNLDEDRLLLQFAEGLQLRRIERLPKPEPQGVFSQKKRPARQAPLWRRFLTPDLIFGVGIAGIILFFALWTTARISAMRTAESRPTPPGIVDILLTPMPRSSGTPGAEGTPLPEGTAQANLPPLGTSISGQSANASGPDTSGAPVSGGANPGAANQGGNSNAPVVPVAPAGTGMPQTTATLPPMNKDPLQVYIVARQRAWMRVITDNKVKFLGRVVPGNAYAFSASDRIELSTGSASALQVFYNQNDLGVLGIMGEVVNLVFSADGIATPTPAFTPTNTPTKPATATPPPSPTAPATPTITPFVPRENE